MHAVHHLLHFTRRTRPQENRHGNARRSTRRRRDTQRRADPPAKHRFADTRSGSDPHRLDGTLRIHPRHSGTVGELSWRSPGGKFAGFGKQISEALGRKRDSFDVRERHPFDVELARIEPGCTPCPYHQHSAQWEFYYVVAGSGRVRHVDGATAIEPGDAFIFEPDQPHQLFNDGAVDLILIVVADNPIGESCYYPDSQKWAVAGEAGCIRSEPLDYFDGEE
jgi:mannose-6-phosphate isomerase-like protein (cupin superfamily)